MRSAARAIGWELARRHRIAPIVFLVYFAGFFAIKTWVLGPDAALRIAPPNDLVGFYIGPLTIAGLVVLGMFTYGLSGDMAARESAFPRRMFTLPVSNLELVGWPMLYGAVTMASLWAFAVLYARALGGLGIDLPFIWPALLGVSLLAWMQALVWMAYPLRGVRIVMAILLITAIDAVVILAIHFRAEPGTMVALLAPHPILAFLTAWWAVSRARHAEVPDWGRFFARTGAARSERPFRSARHAQAWLEWRRHGRNLPALVTLVVPPLLLLLFIPAHNTEGIVFAILAIALVMPPVLALFAAPAMSGFSTYAATRPLSTLSLVTAKLRMTLWSAAAAWLLTAVLVVGALWLAGRLEMVAARLQAIAATTGTARLAIFLALVLAALFLATWKNLVQSLCIGLTNRPRLIRASVIFSFAVATAAFPIAYTLLFNDRVKAAVWEMLPWIVAALVALKTLAACWVAIRLHGEGVLGDRALVAAALAWLAAVAALYALLAALAASPIFPFYALAGLAVLFVPLARLAAAPLALATRRHR